jgi:hypothetical protein
MACLTFGVSKEQLNSNYGVNAKKQVMRPFELSLGNLLLRYFLMMGLIIAGLFSQQYWLAFLGFPVFLTAIMGISFKRTQRNAIARSVARREPLQAQRAA